VDGMPVAITVGSATLVGTVEALTQAQVVIAGSPIELAAVVSLATPRGRFDVEVADEKAPPRADTDPAWDDDPAGSVEDIVDGQGTGEQEPLLDPEPEVERLEGTGRTQLTLMAGGEAPDSSSFRMQGGKVPVEGQFEKGDIIDLLVKVRVTEVDFVDKHDNDGYVVGTDRRHIAKPLSIRRYVAE
jgi:hypothetical protein